MSVSVTVQMSSQPSPMTGPVVLQTMTFVLYKMS